MRQRVGELAAGSGARPAVRTTYNLDGRVINVERGSASALSSAGAFTGFSTLENNASLYDAQGRKVRDTFLVGAVAQALTQSSYDAAGRLECAAVRMNPAAFGSLPASACALGAQGASGPDRISRTSYDAANRVLSVQTAYATALVQTTRTNAWTQNGALDYVEDANGNRSDYSYDGFDRLTRLDFPVTTLGAHAANANDNEQYSYDAAGNRTSLKLRSGETIGYSYDNLNREMLKDIPGGAANDVYSGYDLLGRRLSARFSSANGQGIVYSYDALSRVTGETETFNNRALSYQYDPAGNRTRVTYPDANYVSYSYDALNRMSAANENGAAALATYSYDLLSRRTNVAFANGTNSSFAYSANSQNWSLTNNLAGTTQDVTFALGFNPARQVISRDISNTLYNYVPPALSQSYTRNGLNQYTSVGGATYTNDQRGNLTSDGARSFVYDLENRLLSVAGSASGMLSYDPLGRLRTYASGGATTTFLYSGDQLVAEYNGATMLRRYVHGAGIDTPIAWYEGATLAANSRRFLHTDHQGSIVATSDNAGAATIYNYGPYGEPTSWTSPTPVSRFRYTGQIALPEIQLYHYKARAYDPARGRFLQTDPVGYEDDLNLYAYVRNDPLNLTDSSGASIDCWEDQSCDTNLQSTGGDGEEEGVVPWQQRMDQIFRSIVGTSESRAASVERGVKELQTGLEGLERVMGPAMNSPEGIILGIIFDPSPAGELRAGGRAIEVVDGFVDAAGSAFRFRPQYYDRLWQTGRPAPFLAAQEVLETATSVAPDVMPGFYRYSNGAAEMVYNPTTREVWHLQPTR